MGRRLTPVDNRYSRHQLQELMKHVFTGNNSLDLLEYLTSQDGVVHQLLRILDDDEVAREALRMRSHYHKGLSAFGLALPGLSSSVQVGNTDERQLVEFRLTIWSNELDAMWRAQRVGDPSENVHDHPRILPRSQTLAGATVATYSEPRLWVPGMPGGQNYLYRSSARQGKPTKHHELEDSVWHMHTYLMHQNALKPWR